MTKRFDLDALAAKRPTRDVFVGGKLYKVPQPPVRDALKLATMDASPSAEDMNDLLDMVQRWLVAGMPKAVAGRILAGITIEELEALVTYLQTGETEVGEQGEDEAATEQPAT